MVREEITVEIKNKFEINENKSITLKMFDILLKQCFKKNLNAYMKEERFKINDLSFQHNKIQKERAN